MSPSLLESLELWLSILVTLSLGHWQSGAFGGLYGEDLPKSEEYTNESRGKTQGDHSLMASQEPVSEAMEDLQSMRQVITILTAFNKENPDKVSVFIVG